MTSDTKVILEVMEILVLEIWYFLGIYQDKK